MCFFNPFRFPFRLSSEPSYEVFSQSKKERSFSNFRIAPETFISYPFLDANTPLHSKSSQLFRKLRVSKSNLATIWGATIDPGELLAWYWHVFGLYIAVDRNAKENASQPIYFWFHVSFRSTNIRMTTNPSNVNYELYNRVKRLHIRSNENEKNQFRCRSIIRGSTPSTNSKSSNRHSRNSPAVAQHWHDLELLSIE